MDASSNLSEIISAQKQRKRFSIAQLSRWRWNVLDLVKLCNQGAVPTYIFMDVDMSWAEQLRADFRKRGEKITVTAIILKAIAIAQVKHPSTRTAILPWNRVVTLNDIVGSFTVERFVDGQPAVYFGTIKAPHTKSLPEIARELDENGKLEFSQVPQLYLEHQFAKFPWWLRRMILWIGVRWPAARLMCLDATFGISSLGKYAIRSLVPPCVCASTFGIGVVEQRAVVRSGEIVIRPMMTLCLNFDHRAIDGAPAARFMGDIKLLLEGEMQEFAPAAPEAQLGAAAMMHAPSSPTS